MAADRFDETGNPSEPPHPMGEALEWVGRVLAISMEMLIPGLAGQWLDRRLGTGFLVILGFVLGVTAGIAHLLIMTTALKRKTRSRGDDKEQSQ